MTHEYIKALDKLIAAVESGGEIFPSNFPMDFRGRQWAIRAHYGSLDAAKALHEALLPDRLWEITPAGNVYIRDIEYNKLSKAFVTNNPARALLIAILKSYRAKIDVKPNQNN